MCNDLILVKVITQVDKRQIALLEQILRDGKVNLTVLQQRTCALGDIMADHSCLPCAARRFHGFDTGGDAAVRHIDGSDSAVILEGLQNLFYK